MTKSGDRRKSEPKMSSALAKSAKWKLEVEIESCIKIKSNQISSGIGKIKSKEEREEEGKEQGRVEVKEERMTQKATDGRKDAKKKQREGNRAERKLLLHLE